MRRPPASVAATVQRTVPPPPVSYQGGKRRLAPAILDAIRPDPAAPFWDLCCGGGAVALEALRRGHRPELLTLVDAGPWGEVWRDIGAGTFDLALLKRLLADVPNPLGAPLMVKNHLAHLARQPVAESDRPAVFLLLQGGAWGGRAIGWDGAWCHSGFHPGCTHEQCTRHLPFSPSPAVVYDRTARLCDLLLGARGICSDVRDVRLDDGVAYLDPPYANAARYPSGALDAAAFATSLPVPCWVSERRPLAPGAVPLLDRHPGGITGGHKASREEWLSFFAAGHTPATRAAKPATSSERVVATRGRSR